MLLSDDEIDAIADKCFVQYMNDENDAYDLAFARAIEAAILAKLAVAKLPEPVHFVDACAVNQEANCKDCLIHCTKPQGVFTTAQLNEAHAQGFAAGAAAQLSSEPVFFAYQYDDGTWHDGSATEHSVGMKHLYTRREAK